MASSKPRNLRFVSKKIKKTKGSGGTFPGKFGGKSTSGRTPAFGTLLPPSSAAYKSVLKQYDAKWDKSRCRPTWIRAIYEVKCPDQLKRFKVFQHTVRSAPSRFKFAGPGNTLRRYHGTAMRCRFNGSLCTDPKCSCCGILRNGFDISKLGSATGNKGNYGAGLYFTSVSSTAKGYGLKPGYSYQQGNYNDPKAGNCILVCSVVCGKCEIVKKTTNRPIDRSKYSSRCIDKGSNVDELVVPTGKQVLPRYVICF